MSRTVEIKIPGAFDSWFEGTGLLQGQDDSEPDIKATRLAWEAGRLVNVGRGHYTVVTATEEVLRVLAEYGEYCLDANADEPEHSEIVAARKVIKRSREALASLAGES